VGGGVGSGRGDQNLRPSFGGLTANRIAKRYIIAGALLAGITVAAVARQLGV
jgi:hypothetical protein